MGKHSKKIRYAVVGVGHIAQVAVLPGFKHASNSKLTALVSSDPVKLEKLGRKYGVTGLYDYDQYDALLSSGEIDAVYIALPNDQHKDYAIRAARAGIHVLCEKPMALTVKDGLEMIRVSEQNHVKLMIAYRLHFDEAHLKAVELIRSKKLGEPRIFNSVFSYSVQEGNIRTEESRGGGPLNDIGIYCINAARSLFGAEPIEVLASVISGKNKKLHGVEETVSAILKFSEDRVASFTCSFGAAATNHFQVLGTRGELRVENAYEYLGKTKQQVSMTGAHPKTKHFTFGKRDQFGPEILYFSRCILENKQPEPSGLEGVADLRIIEALFKSAASGKRVVLNQGTTTLSKNLSRALTHKKRPTLKQKIKRAPVQSPTLVHVEKPSSDQ